VRLVADRKPFPVRANSFWHDLEHVFAVRIADGRT
jgi:hypothetical protein